MSALNIPPLPERLSDSGDALEAFVTAHVTTDADRHTWIRLITNHALLVAESEYRAAMQRARSMQRYYRV